MSLREDQRITEKNPGFWFAERKVGKPSKEKRVRLGAQNEEHSLNGKRNLLMLNSFCIENLTAGQTFVTWFCRFTGRWTGSVNEDPPSIRWKLQGRTQNDCIHPIKYQGSHSKEYPLITISKWRTISLNSQPISSAKLLKYLPREAIPRYTRVRLRFPPSAFLVDRRKSKSWRDFLSQKATTMRWKIFFLNVSLSWMWAGEGSEYNYNRCRTTKISILSRWGRARDEVGSRAIYAIFLSVVNSSKLRYLQHGQLFQAISSWLLYPCRWYTFKWIFKWMAQWIMMQVIGVRKNKWPGRAGEVGSCRFPIYQAVVSISSYDR